MHTVRFLIITVLGFALAAQVGCSQQTMETRSDLKTLRNALIKQYNEANINVTVQDSHQLGIAFINSSFNNLGEQGREQKAREIALFARTRHPAIGSIDTIWVAFVASINYLVVSYSESRGVYGFETKRLLPPGSKSENSQATVTASYNEMTREKTVYLSKNLQVFSEDGRGISLFPHFTVPPEGASPARVPTPGSVRLDFSTFSEQRMFPDNPRLLISVDNQKIFSGIAKTTSVFGSKAEKSVNESLSAEISYDQFVKVANGKEVTFKLGSRDLALTAPQLQILREMKKSVDGL